MENYLIQHSDKIVNSGVVSKYELLKLAIMFSADGQYSSTWDIICELPEAKSDDFCKKRNRQFEQKLRSLFDYWYGFSDKINESENPNDIFNCNSFVDVSNSQLEFIWTRIWFAKGERQKVIDSNLKKLEPWLEEFINYEPIYLYEYIALIILYDQIPRNIFRGTSNAYSYDHISNKYAHYLLNAFSNIKIFNNLYVCKRYTILICLCHQEGDINIFDIIIDRVNKFPSHTNITLKTVMTCIVYNHRERIELFGRFPERNKPLGRISTSSELAYLKGLY